MIQSKYHDSATEDTVTIQYHYDESGQLFGLRYNEVDYIYQRDIFGSIMGIIDLEGKLLIYYTYNGFGEPSIHVQTEGMTLNDLVVASKLKDYNIHIFKGYIYDQDTKMYYLNSRYYDPRIGRFITPDDPSYLSVESINGLNLYAYCGNNPVMYLNSARFNPVNTDGIVPNGFSSISNQGTTVDSGSGNSWRSSWFNSKGQWYNGTGSIYAASYGDFSFSAGVAKIALLNFTQKNFRIVNAQIDLVRAEYNLNDYALIHATLGTGKAFIAFNFQDGFGVEAKLVILTIGAKSGPIGINFDIGAVGFTAKYVNEKLEIGASAAVGFTISINLFEAYEWIKEHGGI